MSFFYILLLSMRISEMSLQGVGLFNNSLMKSTQFFWWVWKLKPPNNTQSIPTENPQLPFAKQDTVCLSEPSRSPSHISRWRCNCWGAEMGFQSETPTKHNHGVKNGLASLSSETLVGSHAVTSACYRAKPTTILAEINYPHWTVSAVELKFARIINIISTVAYNISLGRGHCESCVVFQWVDNYLTVETEDRFASNCELTPKVTSES